MTFRTVSGVNDQYLYFTAPPGLGTWTVYRARNGAAAAIMTSPTIAEVDSGMPGLYTLLMDEDMAIEASNTTEHMAFHISAAGWSGAIFTIEIYNPVRYQVGLLTNSVDADALATDAVTEIAQGTWSELLGDSGYSASAIMQIAVAAAAGKISGAGTSTITIRSVEDDANIIVATVDANGNRSVVTITTPGD